MSIMAGHKAEGGLPHTTAKEWRPGDGGLDLDRFGRRRGRRPCCHLETFSLFPASEFSDACPLFGGNVPLLSRRTRARRGKLQVAGRVGGRWLAQATRSMRLRARSVQIGRRKGIADSIPKQEREAIREEGSAAESEGR